VMRARAYLAELSSKNTVPASNRSMSSSHASTGVISSRLRRCSTRRAMKLSRASLRAS